jgi:hypothetical protein
MATKNSRLVTNNIVEANLHENVVYIEHTTTSSCSVGDVYRMVPVPHGAKIIDAWARVGLLNTAGEFNLGTTSDPDAFLASATATAARYKVSANLGVGTYEVSISDDLDGPNRYETVNIQIAGTVSNQPGIVLGVGVRYKVGDPQAGS